MEWFTDLARLLVGTAVLSFASYTDWKWRRAPNLLWLIVLAAAALLIVVDAVANFAAVREAAVPYLLIAPALVALFWVLYQVGMIAGGADAKALMALAFLVPWPIILTPSVPVLQSPMPGGVVVFTNSLVAFMVIPLAFLVMNAARGDFGLPAFVGIRRRLADIDRGHYWLMERARDGRVVRKWFASRGAYDLEEEKANLAELGVERAWVTPKVPFMIPLAVGFVLAFFAGDVLFGLMGALLR